MVEAVLACRRRWKRHPPDQITDADQNEPDTREDNGQEKESEVYACIPTQRVGIGGVIKELVASANRIDRLHLPAYGVRVGGGSRKALRCTKLLSIDGVDQLDFSTVHPLLFFIAKLDHVRTRDFRFDGTPGLQDCNVVDEQPNPGDHERQCQARQEDARQKSDLSTGGRPDCLHGKFHARHPPVRLLLHV